MPPDKKLFFPIANTIYIPTLPSETPEIVRRSAWEYANTLGGSVTIDDVPVDNIADYRLPPGPNARDKQINRIPLFQINVPADNLCGADLPAGTYSGNAQDGYYLMLAPLSRGRHKIHIVGTSDNSVIVDVTYTLIVGRG
ncbi:MAG: hypothetical protein HGA45_06895 [Chloroflexales bacterium]|nr:hypothetical protein [Chloroflexales bacterium]